MEANKWNRKKSETFTTVNLAQQLNRIFNFNIRYTNRFLSWILNFSVWWSFISNRYAPKTNWPKCSPEKISSFTRWIFVVENRRNSAFESSVGERRIFFRRKFGPFFCGCLATSYILPNSLTIAVFLHC